MADTSVDQQAPVENPDLDLTDFMVEHAPRPNREGQLSDSPIGDPSGEWT